MKGINTNTFDDLLRILGDRVTLDPAGVPPPQKVEYCEQLTRWKKGGWKEAEFVFLTCVLGI